MNKYILHFNIKQNWLIWIIVFAVLMMYFSVIINMYDPESNEDLMKLAAMKMSPEMLKAFGFNNLIDNSLIGFINSYLYGFLCLMLPLIFTITTSNKLIASHLEKGSLAFFLSTPITRNKFYFTQCLFLLSATWLLLVCTVSCVIIMCEIHFPKMLDIRAFINLNVVLGILLTLISSIGLFASAVFNSTKASLAFGAGLPIAFFIIKMMHEANSDYAWLKYFTVYSLFENNSIIMNNYSVIPIVIMLILLLLLISTSAYIFNKKDISI